MKRSWPPSEPHAWPLVAPGPARSARLTMASSRKGDTARSGLRLEQAVQVESHPLLDSSSQGQSSTESAAGRGWIETVAAPGSVETGTLVSEPHCASQAAATAPALSGASGTSDSIRARK